MSELSDYLNAHRPGGMSLRDIQREAERRGHKLNFSTAGRYLAGDHRTPSEEVLKAFAAVFSVNYQTLRNLSELGPTGDPFDLGPEAAALTGPQRDVIRRLVKVFLDDNMANRPLPHGTTTPTQSDYTLAAHTAPNRGKALRDRMNAEQETPEPFYDGDEPA